MKTRHGLEIRAATAVDAQGLCDLLTAAGHATSPRALADRVEALHDAPGAALIAADWGPPIGLILVHWYRTLLADQPTAQITALLVAPAERRRGIGRLLLKAAAQSARIAGCGALEFATASHQHDLQEFCRANGFTADGPRFVRHLRKKP